MASSPPSSNPAAAEGTRIATENTPLLPPVESNANQEDQNAEEFGWGRVSAIACAVMVLLFLQGSNISALTTIESNVAADLDAFAQSSWFTSSYVIAMSSTSPLLGRLSKIFSPRWCLFVASLLFALGNIVAGLAPTFAGFVTGRAISGVGGAGIVACSIMLVLQLAPEKRRGLSLGLVNTGFTIGVSLGAVLAGALVAITGWREIFLVQAPLSAIAGICAAFAIPASMHKGHANQSILQQLARIDYLGMITLIVTLVLFLASLASTEVLLLPLIVSAGTLCIFLFIEGKVASDPIIPISVLRSRGAMFSSLGAATLMMTRWLVLFYAPKYALSVQLWKQSTAGTFMIPANAGFGVGGLLVGGFHIRRAGSFYLPCVIVLALFTASLFVLSQISTASTSIAVYMSVLFANGLCTGAALNYTLVHVLHLTWPSTHFIMTSLMTTFRGFGASFGSAIGGGIFARSLVDGYHYFCDAYDVEPDPSVLKQLLGSPASVASLEGITQEIAIRSYEAAFERLFIVGGAISVAAVLMQAGTGWSSPKQELPSEDTS